MVKKNMTEEMEINLQIERHEATRAFMDFGSN